MHFQNFLVKEDKEKIMLKLYIKNYLKEQQMHKIQIINLQEKLQYILLGDVKIDGNDFADHKDLCESVFGTYERVTLLDKDSVVIDANHPEKYYLEESFYALLTSDEKESIRIDYKVNPNEKSAEVGVAEVYLKDSLLGSVKIYQREESKEEKKENFFQRFLRWLFRW